jgi:hypothetical protein
MDMDCIDFNCRDYFWRNSSNDNSWAPIMRLLILMLLFFSCRIEQPLKGEWKFFFSKTQFSNSRSIRYFVDKRGKIFPFTDYTNERHFATKYYDTMFVGFGTVIPGKVNKEKIMFPASKFNENDYQ